MVSAAGRALQASFLSRNEEVTGEGFFSCTPAQSFSDYLKPHKTLSRLLRTDFSGPQCSGLAGLRTEPLEATVQDIPPSAQLDIEGFQSHKEIQLTFPREISKRESFSEPNQAQDIQTHFHHTLECSQSLKR